MSDKQPPHVVTKEETFYTEVTVQYSEYDSEDGEYSTEHRDIALEIVAGDVEAAKRLVEHAVAQDDFLDGHAGEFITTVEIFDAERKLLAKSAGFPMAKTWLAPIVDESTVAETRESIASLRKQSADEAGWDNYETSRRLSEAASKLASRIEIGENLEAKYAQANADARSTQAPPPNTAHDVPCIVLSITETGNAAFIDGGREFEIARILDTLAETVSAVRASVETREGKEAQRSALDGFPLFDLNGNKVGAMAVTRVAPTGDVPPGVLRLVIDKDHDVPGMPGTLERTARLLALAASGVREGQREFPLVLVGNDGSRHEFGNTTFAIPESWQSHDRIDLSDYLSRNAVRKAEGGYGGIAEGEFRYVVGAGDFEFGYELDAGPVYLVSAIGEVADGYENGDKIVRETYTCDLPRDEREALQKVAKGTLALDEFERMYGATDDNEPEV
jgi:hypothetical protein